MIALHPITARLRQAFDALRSRPTTATVPALPEPAPAPVARHVGAVIEFPRRFPPSRDHLVHVIRDPEWASGGIDDPRNDAFDGVDDSFPDDSDQTTDCPEAGYGDGADYYHPPVMARRVRYIGSRIRPSCFALAG